MRLCHISKWRIERLVVPYKLLNPLDFTNCDIYINCIENIFVNMNNLLDICLCV